MPFEKITSIQNAFIKKVAGLRDRDAREAEGLTIVEGVREVTLALKKRVPLVRVYVCFEGTSATVKTLAAQLQRAGTEILETDRRVFEKISFGDRFEGILGVCRPVKLAPADLPLGPDALVAVLEHVEKPGNLGAILRTCDAAGVHAVMVADGKTDIYNPNVIRSSLGAVFTVPVAAGSNEDVLQALKARGVRIVGTFPAARTPYTAVDWRRPSAIVLGSEDAGLSDFWQRAADEKVMIPQKGDVNSLNVSASAAIVVYEAVRQRGVSGK